MPSFFARRYYRPIDRVSGTEKALGMGLLFLAVAVVAGYIAYAATNKEYLFNVDEAAYEAGEQPRELLIARRMLPALGSPDWQAAGDPEAIQPDQFASTLGEDARALIDFDVQRVYRQRYIQTPAGQAKAGDSPALNSIAVSVCDAQSSAQAFGLTKKRRPAGAAPLNVGRDGWISADGLRAGFWIGRYYTELNAVSELTDTTLTLPLAAGAISSVQLDYGETFPLDQLLPTQGRKPDSLRYVHRGAFDIEGLDEVFLVEMSDGTSVWLSDAHSPARAQQRFEQVKAAFSSGTSAGPGTKHDERAGDYGEFDVGEGYAEPGITGESADIRYDGPLTIMTFRAGRMAFFTAGRYVGGAYGGAPGGDAVTAAGQLYDRVMSTIVETPGAPVVAQPAEQESPFPDIAAKGWQVPSQVDRFTPENLYIKINGRADVYLQFHVVSLIFGTYFHQTEGERTIDVYWYDMGTPANALGIYQAEASPGAEPVPVGQNGYQVGGAVFFHKGGCYVHVLPADPNDAGVALAIARRIDENIAGSTDEMWALKVLPQSGRIEGSFAYIAQDAFSLDFLGDVYTAEFELEGRRLTLFVHRAADGDTAGDLLRQYTAFFEKYGEVVWQDEDAARRMVAGEVAGVVDVVFAKGRYLCGVSGASELEAAREAALAFYEELQE
ncbi:MAG: hypothetical protein JSV78_09630 [Phycisphaerales bacterium]|nr:MAG: hypothetical protein JSV78_09630 [Phycisphaerales bacterium]